jgi:bifunctional isochorismate lyase/aryl carrier protein
MFTKERLKHPFKYNEPVLLIIDVQSYFFDPGSKAYIKNSERILPIINQLKTTFQQKNRLVLGTIYAGSNKNMEKWWGHSIEESWTKPLIQDVTNIRKATYDAFYQTELENILKEKRINQLIITGAMTHLCCETTARSAFVRGFEVVMVIDACIDKEEFYHQSSLKNLAHGFATLAESSDLW